MLNIKASIHPQYPDHSINERHFNCKLRKSPFHEFQEENSLEIVKNGPLIFSYLPEFNHYQTNYDDTNYFLVKNIVKELNIPFIDIHKEVFEKEKNPLNFFPFKMPGHYNIEGYKKVAEEIYKFTKD